MQVASLPDGDAGKIRRLSADYTRCREASVGLTAGLSPEDMVVQSMEDASPTKWHLAHTTWFFEEFILSKYCRNYRRFNPNYQYLFNSYYNSIGDRHARPSRGMLTRPSADEVLAYRSAIDEQMLSLLSGLDASQSPKTGSLLNTVVLGLHHEMQHQELMLTDIVHALSQNPLHPALRPPGPQILTASSLAGKQAFIEFEAGLYEIGTGVAIDRPGTANGTISEFSFDCERPRHQSYLQDFSLANRPVTNGEWLAFMADQGYQRPDLWLSDGWALCQAEGWCAPLYWRQQDDQWCQFGADGLRNIDPNAPACHISYFEADAYAHWAGARLPTEQEWEVGASAFPIEGNFQERKLWRPAATCAKSDELGQLFGDVWEWTRSSFSAYPGYRLPAGAIGEYNGKFMSGQYVLRGGSCATPQKQMRHSYRNFFYPQQRWQFAGVRLAKDVNKNT